MEIGMERRKFLEVSAAVLGAPFIPKLPSFLAGNKVALTFDDGFLPRQVEKIAEIADQYGLKFTFFPVGWRVLDREPELWRNIVAAGHEIGNHSHSHRILRTDKISKEEILYDIGLHQVLLDEILGYHYPERFFRPPGGHLEPAVTEAAENLKLLVVKWSLTSGGTDRFATPNSAFNNVIRARGGDNVLLHCIPNDTARLPDMIEVLQNKGLKLVTLSNLLN